MDIPWSQVNTSALTTSSVNLLHFLVSDNERRIIIFVISNIIGAMLTVFGIICNIFNIIVFAKQGFKDTINISLCSIAVADTGTLLAVLWGYLCVTPALHRVFRHFYIDEFVYITSTWPHLYFTRVTAILTCQVTIERYLCIAYPLLVRRLINPRGIAISVVLIYLATSTTVIPVFVTGRLGSKVMWSSNRTLVGLLLSWQTSNVIQMTSVYSSSLQTTAFSIVLITTGLLVRKLYSVSKWRNKNTSGCLNISQRDKRVASMVIVVAATFIICFLPVVLFLLVTVSFPQISDSAYYRNLLTILISCVFLLEATQMTLNIFIYLKMSTHFREMSVSLFECLKPREN